MSKLSDEDDFVRSLKKQHTAASNVAAHTPRMVMNTPPEGASPLSMDDMLNANPVVEEVAPETVASIEISIELVRPGKYQPRLAFDTEYIEQLADNINQVGLNQPIVVRCTVDGCYELIAGENRFRAWKLLNRTHIPAIIRDIDDATAAKASLSDNLQRKNITDFEIALSLENLRSEGIETTISGMARLIGKDRKQVHRLLSFLLLPEAAKDILREIPAILGANYAEELAGLVEQGHGTVVCEAVALIAKGKLTQSRASSWVATRIGTNVRRTSQEQVKSRDGKPVATLRRDGNELRIRCLPGLSVERYEDLLLVALGQADALLEPTLDEPASV